MHHQLVSEKLSFKSSTALATRYAITVSTDQILPTQTEIPSIEKEKKETVSDSRLNPTA